MKSLLLLFTLVLGMSTQAQQNVEPQLDWKTNFEQAQEEARKTGKPILLYFTGSDWCKPCQALKEDFFMSEDFLAMSDQFVMVQADIPFREDIITPEQKAYNKKLQRKYNKENSFPLLIAFDSRGRRLDDIGAYSTMMRDTQYHWKFVRDILARV